MPKCHECQSDFGATGAAALQAPSQGLWGDCQHQNTDTALPSHSTNSDLCAPQAALLPLSPAKDMVLPLLQTPWLPGRHKAESTASHRGAGCSECRSSERAAAEAAGCPVLPGQDLARYQGNIVMRKLFSMVVTQCHTLPGNCPTNFNSVLAVCVDRGSSGFQQQQNHPFLPTTAGREEFYLKKPSVLHFSEH